MSNLKKIFHDYLSQLYLLLIALFLIFPLLSGIFQLINYPLQKSSLFVTSFVISLCLYLLKPIKKYIFSVILFMEITFIGLILLHWLDWIRFVNKELFITSQYLFEILKIELIVDGIHSSIGYVMGLSNIVLYPIYFEMSIQLIVIAILFYFIFKYKSPNFLLGFGLVFVYAWFQYKEIQMTSILLYFIGMLLYTYEYYHYKTFLKGKNNAIETNYYRFKSLRFSYIIMAIIIFFSTQLILAFFPINQVNQKISKYVPSVEGLRTAYYKQKSFGYYTLEDSMYHPLEDTLGGSITKKSDEVILLIKTGADNKYFRGRVKNEYTGDNWINEKIDYKSGRTINATEDIYQAEVHPINLKTITLFSPYKFIKSNFQSDYVFSNEDSIQFYKGPQTPALEKSYTVYWTENYKEDVSMIERRKYLNYPERDLEETIKITREIINDEMTDYEKVKSIEQYLRKESGFKYTLLVSDVNQSKDFVENFLAYEKKGYCTYFASAMAVMGRIAKVPTRYVEGFILPEEKNVDGFYEVTESRAHAWIEAYIKDVGWITLEATPAYQIVASTEESVSDDFNDALMPENNLPDVSDITSEKDLRTEEDFIVEESATQRKGKLFVLVIMIFIFIGVLIALVLNFIMKKREETFNQLSTHEKGNNYIKRIIQLLSIKGYTKKSNEFHLEFIEKKLDNELELSIEAFEYRILEKIFYTNQAIDNESYIIIKDLYERVFEKILGNKNRVTQMYYRFRIR